MSRPSASLASALVPRAAQAREKERHASEADGVAEQERAEARRRRRRVAKGTLGEYECETTDADLYI